MDAGAGRTRENKCGWWEWTHESPQSPHIIPRRQSRPDDVHFARMRARFPRSPGRSHLRDRNNGYVVVNERQKSGSILEPHRFESGPLHVGSRVNSDVGSGRTAPARSDLAQRVRHGIRNSHAGAGDRIEIIRYGWRFERNACPRMPAAPRKALPFGNSLCSECSHRSFLVRRAPDERTNGRVYTPETRICQLNSLFGTNNADERLILTQLNRSSRHRFHLIPRRSRADLTLAGHELTSHGTPAPSAGTAGGGPAESGTRARGAHEGGRSRRP